MAKSYQEMLAAQTVTTDAPEQEKDLFADAPVSAVEIEGFEPEDGGAVKARPRTFSSGNKGWRIDSYGTMHGLKVRVQCNVIVSEPKAKKGKKAAKGDLSPAAIEKLNRLVENGVDVNAALKAVKMMGL